MAGNNGGNSNNGDGKRLIEKLQGIGNIDVGEVLKTDVGALIKRKKVETSNLLATGADIGHDFEEIFDEIQGGSADGVLDLEAVDVATENWVIDDGAEDSQITEISLGDSEDDSLHDKGSAFSKKVLGITSTVDELITHQDTGILREYITDFLSLIKNNNDLEKLAINTLIDEVFKNGKTEQLIRIIGLFPEDSTFVVKLEKKISQNSEYKKRLRNKQLLQELSKIDKIFKRVNNKNARSDLSGIFMFISSTLDSPEIKPSILYRLAGNILKNKALWVLKEIMLLTELDVTDGSNTIDDFRNIMRDTCMKQGINLNIPTLSSNDNGDDSKSKLANEINKIMELELFSQQAQTNDKYIKMKLFDLDRILMVAAGVSKDNNNKEKNINSFGELLQRELKVMLNTTNLSGEDLKRLTSNMELFIQRIKINIERGVYLKR